jgi:hypothetical protein
MSAADTFFKKKYTEKRRERGMSGVSMVGGAR